jgi:uncharacterized protein (PEP-CTERM system associated)
MQRAALCSSLVVIAQASAHADNPSPATPSPTAANDIGNTAATATSGPTEGPAKPNDKSGGTSGAAAPGYNDHYFNTTGSVDISENYTTNASGEAGVDNAEAYTRLGLNLGVNTDRRTASLHASYSLSGDIYQNSRLDQITNNLNAVGDIELIPNNLRIDAQAFATPIVLSRLGILTSNGRAVPNGVTDTYGYSVEPDLKFRLGDAVTSETTVAHGGVFFTQPQGSTSLPAIPGFVNPQNTISTIATEHLSSGTFFSQFQWSLVGSDSETSGIGGNSATRDNISETTAEGTLSYAPSHEIALLATGGYFSLRTDVKLSQKLTGPTFLGGLRINLTPGIYGQFQVGRQFNSASYTGTLHYEVTRSAVFVGSLIDSVTTPAAQLINGLMSQVATPGGGFTNSGDLLSGGSAPTLAGFNPQLFDALSLQQSIVRIRAGQLAFYDDRDRTHLALSLNIDSQDFLSPLAPGEPIHTNSLFGSVSVSRDIRRNFKGTISISYGTDQEFGGRGNILNTTAALDYQLTQKMSVYLHSSYVNRASSSALRKLSPLTGSLNEALVSVGLTRTF